MGFRKDFIWGAATSSYQIEGAVHEDGRASSIWDVFARETGRILGGSTADTACDHYHRYPEDIRILRDLGIRNYRFSFAWPRILPEGTGKENPQGADFYNRLIDEMLSHGIRPFATLYHWDYPATLYARGGWENPDSPKWFADYATLCGRLFGDRVKDFFTLNEPQCFVGLGYQTGTHAPGLKAQAPRLVALGHHVMKGHGLAVQALRAAAPDCRVGYAPCADPCIPASVSPQDVEAARKAYFAVPDGRDWCVNVSWWSDPVMLGRYPEDGLKRFEAFLPSGWADDLDIMRQKLDYYSQNIYSGVLIAHADNSRGYARLDRLAGAPRTATPGWAVLPDALYWGPRFLYERYRTPLLITENGMSCHDVVSLDGKVHDPNRQDFVHRYLLALKRAAQDGADIRGYFQWSLLDNYEWAMGYSERFGIVHVDFETQKRTIKDSAYWYRKVVETNGGCL